MTPQPGLLKPKGSREEERWLPMWNPAPGWTVFELYKKGTRAAYAVRHHGVPVRGLSPFGTLAGAVNYCLAQRRTR